QLCVSAIEIEFIYTSGGLAEPINKIKIFHLVIVCNVQDEVIPNGFHCYIVGINAISKFNDRKIWTIRSSLVDIEFTAAASYSKKGLSAAIVYSVKSVAHNHCCR